MQVNSASPAELPEKCPNRAGCVPTMHRDWCVVHCACPECDATRQHAARAMATWKAFTPIDRDAISDTLEHIEDLLRQKWDLPHSVITAWWQAIQDGDEMLFAGGATAAVIDEWLSSVDASLVAARNYYLARNVRPESHVVIGCQEVA